MFTSFTASAPGKIILAGEHAVVHGTRAIATVVDKRTNIIFSSTLPPTKHQDLPQCDISLTVDYDNCILTHQWDLSTIIAHKKELFGAYMSEIQDYTPCQDDEHHDHNHGIGSQCDDPTVKRPYFTTEQKLLDYIQDHTYPNRHLHHKHHGTLEQLTDIFDRLYPTINVNVYRIDKNSNSCLSVDINTLHASVEVCPAKVFLLYYFLLLLTSTPIQEYYNTNQQYPTLHASITSDLPMGAGLGSSASVTSALAGGYYQVLRFVPNTLPNTPPTTTNTTPSFTFSNPDRQVINTWAFQGERLIHGTPSGVDNTCTVYGGVIAFRRVNGQPEMEFLPSGCIPDNIKIFITNTKQPKNTKALVESVHSLNKSYHFVVQPMFTSIEQITQVLLDSIRKYIDRESSFMTEDEIYTIFKDVLRINQCLLDALGVSHPKINQVLAITSEFNGELTTKLTGAGGGGCVITLTKPGVSQEQLDMFKTKIEDNNMEAFLTVMGQSGVLVHPL